jgi:hypothetical protein
MVLSDRFWTVKTILPPGWVVVVAMTGGDWAWSSGSRAARISVRVRVVLFNR